MLSMSLSPKLSMSLSLTVCLQANISAKVVSLPLTVVRNMDLGLPHGFWGKPRPCKRLPPAAELWIQDPGMALNGSTALVSPWPQTAAQTMDILMTFGGQHGPHYQHRPCLQ